MKCYIIYHQYTYAGHYTFPTLYNHLVAGHEDLLPVAGLGILQDSGTRLGCSSVGHGQCLQALNSICAVIGQLDGSSLGDSDCRGI